jgi:hypothetical protein
MRLARILLLLAFVGCGGRMVTVEPDGGLSQPHGAACTQSSCASSVRVIANVPTNVEHFWSSDAMYVGGGFLYVAPGLRLMRVPLAGGDLTPFTGTNDDGPTMTILADDQNVYWVTQEINPRLLRAPHTGGTPFVITTPVAALLVDTTGMFFTTDAKTVTHVMNDGGAETSIPFARPDVGVPMTLRDGQMFRADCTSVAVSSGPALPVGAGMIATDTHCYELHGDCGASYACGDIVSIPIGGGPMTTVVKAQSTISEEFSSGRMMSDSEGIYLLHRDGAVELLGNAKLIRVSFEGGDPVEITTDDDVVAFTITPDTIYWATPARIMSMPKWAP